MFDEKSRGFGRPPIKEGASGHVCKSGEQEFPRILPYPTPVKSLGAKTNHLPNIQGLTAYQPLQEVAGTENSGRDRPSRATSRIESQLIPSGSRESGLFGSIRRVSDVPISTESPISNRRFRIDVARSTLIPPPRPAQPSDSPPTS